MFGRKPAAPVPDPTRISWTVELTGRCCSGHQVSITTQVVSRTGSMGQVTASGSCNCGADVDLTGWIG